MSGHDLGLGKHVTTEAPRISILSIHCMHGTRSSPARGYKGCQDLEHVLLAAFVAGKLLGLLATDWSRPLQARGGAPRGAAHPFNTPCHDMAIDTFKIGAAEYAKGPPLIQKLHPVATSSSGSLARSPNNMTACGKQLPHATVTA